MKQQIQLFQPSRFWSRCLEFNPQFFREIKGKLKTRNIVIAVAISAIAQFVVVIALLSELPDPDPQGIIKTQYGRYALGDGYPDSLVYTKDMLGNWVIHWQLFWFDLFKILSVIGIFALLIIGTYLLIADTVKEESRGTLNFIRLSPQSAGSILLGKILGVPILLYIAVLLILPLHVAAGWGAQIPMSLSLAFYGVIITSCAFIYSLALLWSLVNSQMPGFKPWLGSGLILFFLWVSTVALFHHSEPFAGALLDWLLLFNPAIALSYLIDASYLPLDKFNFVTVENLGELTFYGQALWIKASWGMGFILFNFSLWTYWCWSVLNRRFHNPDRTLISKSQSYWMTGWLVVMALGFTLQEPKYYSTVNNFILLQVCLCALGLGLIAALSPHRQSLYDWARYRHQTQNNQVLWKDLIFGEHSPSVIAVAINMAIAVCYIAPSLWLFVQEDQRPVFWGFVLTTSGLVLYGSIAQLLLTWKTRKRAVWSTLLIANLIILPPLILGFAEVLPQNAPQIWLWSLIPTIAVKYATISQIMLTILGQSLAIAVTGFYLTRRLQQAGRSETKILTESKL